MRSKKQTITKSNDLTILQCNMNKNRSITDSILNDKTSMKFTILALQEHYCTKDTKEPLHHPSWTSIQTSNPASERPRSVIYINNNRLSSSNFEPIHLPFSDVTAVKIKLGTDKPTLLINVYNPCKQDLIHLLHLHLNANLDTNEYSSIIMLGDFNLHHGVWNPQTYVNEDSQANELIEMMADLGLELLLPSGTVTFPRAGTAIDLVWGNESAREAVVKCQVSSHNDHTSDHLPIEIILNLQVPHIEQSQLPFNYEKADWKTMETKLSDYLLTVLDPSTATPVSIDKAATELTNALQRAITETTPRKKACPFSKRWWNENLTNQRKATNKARNRFRRTRNNEDHLLWKEKKNLFRKSIKEAKQKTWREFVENADEKSIWQVKKYMNATPTQAYVPTLKDTATSNEIKAKEFQATFFPPPPPADTSDLKVSTDYPEAVSYNPKITMQQVARAIEKLAPKKAPGPDGISNLVLKKMFPIIKHHITALAQASFDMGHFPAPFKTTTTVVLRKPGKPDYTKPNAYRPIALENTLGKVLESIIAEILSYLTEEYQLLPPQHYGGRPGRTTEDAMMVLSERIHTAWKHQEIFSVIFMDVAGAFNNVHHERLLHNLRKRRIPEQLAKWICSFLRERNTQLKFNGYTTDDVPTPAGTPQGSPLSPLLYMYYNGDLLDIPPPQHLSLGFIDDIAYGVQGLTDTGNVEKLQEMLEKAEEWRKMHGAQFEKTKYLLVHFTRSKTWSTNASIEITGTTIEPTNEARYLGVIFDKQLRFKEHMQYVVKKGMKFILAMSSAAKATWGAEFKYVRQLFTAVAAPRTDYAACIWHRLEDKLASSTHQATELAKVQNMAMKTITGAFRTTPTAALQYETGLLPPELRLQHKILRSFTRMQTLPTSHPLQAWIQKARNVQYNSKQRYISNLENLAIKYSTQTAPVETIHPYIRPPWYSPKITPHIEPTKEKAKEHHDKQLPKLRREPSTICFYTDGSGINENIGAAVYSATVQTMKKQYIGKETESNVFAAELTAINLALKIAEENPQYTKCEIFTDSQTSIKALLKPGKQSGQAIICSILDKIDELQTQRSEMNITLTWIPGHMDIEGNERADKAAKEASNPMEAEVESNVNYPTLKSARNAANKQQIQAKWIKQWNEGTATAVKLRAMSKRPHFTSGRKLYSQITVKQYIAWLVRLRTAHCSLNKYLHQRGHEEEPLCACREDEETIEHFLLKCKKYTTQREKMVKEVGAGGMRVEKLVGDLKCIKYTMEYVKETNRFGF